MRSFKLLPVFLIVCSFAATASAQKVGERIVVTSNKASLRSQDETTGTVTKGTILVVKNVNGDWFWVIWSSGETDTVKGWINRSDVIPFSQALDFFNEDLRQNPSADAYRIRGTIWSEKGDNDNAISDYNDAIRLDPKRATAYYKRGNGWVRKGEYDKAIADFDVAIRLDPKNALIYNNRALAWNKKGEYDKAISDCNEAIRLNPMKVKAYTNRGNAWKNKGQYDNAISDYNKAIRLDAKETDSLNAKAWIYATCPDPRFRDDEKAFEYAMKACEMAGFKNASYLETLAAAYAEAGDFKQAVKCETKARDMISEKEKADYQSRLDLYEAGKPYRDEVKK